jgi:hypothetical protein
MENNKKIALKMAKLCKEAYKNCSSLSSFTLIRVKNHVCFIVEDKENVYCVFRGTDEFTDLGVYFDYPKCFQICELVYNFVVSRDRKVYLGGHSMGGLIALIASTFFGDEDRVEKIVTFGSPKCKFLIKFPHDNWIHRKDFVADLPIDITHSGNVFVLTNHPWKFWRNNHSIKSYIINILEYECENGTST